MKKFIATLILSPLFLTSTAFAAQSTTLIVHAPANASSITVNGTIANAGTQGAITTTAAGFPTPVAQSTGLNYSYQLPTDGYNHQVDYADSNDECMFIFRAESMGNGSYNVNISATALKGNVSCSIKGVGITNVLTMNSQYSPSKLAPTAKS